MNYRLILQRDEPDRVLYLAVPLDVYETFFKLEFTQLAIVTYQFKIIVYNTEDEVVLQWIN
jgi:XisH protein